MESRKADKSSTENNPRQLRGDVTETCYQEQVNECILDTCPETADAGTLSPKWDHHRFLDNFFVTDRQTQTHTPHLILKAFQSFWLGDAEL